jgi:phage shock protein PspC (stress-responsive transcriptional regulator)
MSTDSTTSSEQQRNGYPPLSALRRSRTDRKVLGVAGGLGRYAGIDPLVFRILFVVLTFFGGSGLLFYALGWLLVPDDGETESEGQRVLHGSSRKVSTIIVMIVVLIAGLAWTGSLLHSSPGFGGIGVLIVIAAAVLLLRNGQHARPVAPSVPEGGSPVPAAEPGAYGQTPGTAYSAPAPAFAPASGYAPTAPLPAYGPPPPPSPKERSILGRATLSIALIVVGLLVGWNAATSSDVPAEVVFASALGVVGLGLLVGAVAGRARGLVVWGLLLTALTTVAGTAFSGVPVAHGAGERTWRPVTTADLRPSYRLGVGHSILDLSGLDLSAAGRERVAVRQGVGEITIVVPKGVVVLVHADVNAGNVMLPGRSDVNGTNVSERLVLPAGSSPSSAVLVIDAHLGVGNLEVRRAAS